MFKIIEKPIKEIVNKNYGLYIGYYFNITDSFDITDKIPQISQINDCHNVNTFIKYNNFSFSLANNEPETLKNKIKTIIDFNTSIVNSLISFKKLELNSAFFNFIFRKLSSEYRIKNDLYAQGNKMIERYNDFLCKSDSQELIEKKILTKYDDFSEKVITLIDTDLNIGDTIFKLEFYSLYPHNNSFKIEEVKIKEIKYDSNFKLNIDSINEKQDSRINLDLCIHTESTSELGKFEMFSFEIKENTKLEVHSKNSSYRIFRNKEALNNFINKIE